ncbi:MAG: hypothetical protein HQM15_05550 [Deltaproteobacteria bacterium]|nr:hypothetical protein [Deltaproteobacteria bacterium]
MEKIIYIPAPKEIKLFFEDLFAKKIEVETAPAFSYPFTTPTLVGSFIDSNSLEIKVLVVTDLPFACFAGGALSMIPAAVVKEDIKENKVTPNILDNLKEIMNITLALCNREFYAHLKLKDMFDSKSLPEEFTTLLQKKAAQVVAVEIEIASYGKGKFALLAY